MSNLIINTWYGIIVRREEAFGLDWSDPPSVVLSYAQGFLSEKLQQPAEQRPSNIHTVTAAFCGSTGAAWTSDHRQRGCGCVEANGNGQQPTLLRPRTSAVRPASAPRMKVADRYPATRARPGRKEAVRAAGSRGKISAAASVGLSYATACWAGARSQTGHNRCVLPMRFAMRAFRGRAGILGLCFRTMTTSLGCGSVEPKEGPVTLRIVQVTDVYKIDNFPSLKTLIAEKKAEMAPGSVCVSVLTGDFLAPYLLSSVDKGKGMMTMLNATPIDYLTWGNHETDLKHHEVMACESMYNGIFINTNMRDHESCFRPGSRQRDSVVLDLVDRESGWTHARRVGLVGLLLNDKGIYRPGAFGGATIEDPWEVLRQYNASLREEAGCDLVIPLCHFYQAQDRRTAREFPGQFPVILSGHDHHPVDEIVEGTSTRLLKPGSNAEFAVVVDITWENSNKDCNPSVNAETVHVNDWAPDEEAYAIMKAAMQVLTAMRQTTLMIPGKAFRPLTSVGIRRTSVTMGTLLCTEIRKAINSSEGLECDACLIKGGAFRGEARYLDTASFTLATLEEELPRNQPVAILPVPGRVLAAGMAWNRRAPGAAWLQTDDMLKEGPGGVLLEVGGATFDPDTVYKVATFPGLWCTPGCPISTYLRRHCRGLLDVDDDMPVQALLMGYWASSAWARIRSMLDVDGDGVITAEELALLDTNKDGRLCEEELREALCRLGFDSCCGENKFLSQVLSAGGSEGGGLTLEDINSEQPAKPLKR